MARPNLIQPGPLCAPCVKEEICRSKAQGNIQAGHRLFRAGAWTEEEARQWNDSLDLFILTTNRLLEAKLAAGGEA